MRTDIVAAAFAGYAFGIAWALARVVLRHPPWKKQAKETVMPMIRSKPHGLQTHSSGCWRWASHWECAVALVEEFSVAATDMLDALDTEHKDYGLVVERWKTTNYPGLLMSAADKLIELIAEVEGGQDEGLSTQNART